MKKKGKIFIGIIAVLAALLVLSRIGGGGEQAEAATAEVPVPVFAVNTTTAVQGQIQNYLSLSGDIVAGSSVDAYSDVTGKVNKIYVSLGSSVLRNAPLAEVDTSRPGMSFLPALIRSPVSGTIVSLPAQIGMTVTQGTPLARISGGQGLEIQLSVAERFISKMSLGLSAEISLDAYPGENFQGKVSSISPVVDPVSRTMEVKVSVDNAGSRLKAGMFTKVRVVTEKKDSIVKIPAAAMQERFGENYVFTVAANPADPNSYVAKRTPVVPGILIDGVLEVRQGLSPNDEIVIRGQSLLEDGSRINVIDRVAPPGAGN
jgi:multidrug efflux pump subunit AcrA (membrane-fusion protein)